MLLWIPANRRPKTIFQSVWLIDEWPKRNILQREVYRRLLAIGDVLTFLSPVNAEAARRLFPKKRIEVLHFGISTPKTEFVKSRPLRSPSQAPLRLIAVGNDIHQDWETLRKAVNSSPDFEVKIVSTRIPTDFLKEPNAVARVANNAELFSLYKWADVAVVPLVQNFHASGITAIQEAVVRGVPVICTDTGGLDHYFPRDEVTYVPVGDPEGLRKAVTALCRDPARLTDQVQRAQSRMIDGDLNVLGYVRRHAEISLELLQRPAVPSSVYSRPVPLIR